MSAKPLRLFTVEQLSELPPTENLAGTRLIARGFNVIFGASGTFKSFYALGLALQVAQTAPVVYVAAEGAGGLHRRIEAWAKYHGQPTTNLYFICQEINLLKLAEVQKLGKLIHPLKPALVVFDTLARCASGWRRKLD